MGDQSAATVSEQKQAGNQQCISTCVINKLFKGSHASISAACQIAQGSSRQPAGTRLVVRQWPGPQLLCYATPFAARIAGVASHLLARQAHKQGITEEGACCCQVEAVQSSRLGALLHAQPGPHLQCRQQRQGRQGSETSRRGRFNTARRWNGVHCAGTEGRVAAPGAASRAATAHAEPRDIHSMPTASSSAHMQTTSSTATTTKPFLSSSHTHLLDAEGKQHSQLRF